MCPTPCSSFQQFVLGLSSRSTIIRRFEGRRTEDLSLPADDRPCSGADFLRSEEALLRGATLSEEMGGADDIFWALERFYFEHHQSVRRMADHLSA